MKRSLGVALATTLLLGASAGSAWAQVAANDGNDEVQFADVCDTDDDVDVDDNTDVQCEDEDNDVDEDETVETHNDQHVAQQHANNADKDADDEDDD